MCSAVRVRWQDVRPADDGSIGPPPPPPYPGPGVRVSNPPPPPYSGPAVNLSNLPAPRYPGPASVHAAANPPLAPQHPGPTAIGGYPPPRQLGWCAQKAVRLWNSCYLSVKDRRREFREGRPTVLPSESRVWKWALFSAGNLITVAGIVYEIAGLNVCFDEKVALTDDDDDNTPRENAHNAYTWTMIMFVVGLWVDLFSAVSLSAIYRYPLDIKSAHLIPPGDTRHLRMRAVVDFLAPFSWGTVYFWGGPVSTKHAENSTCGGGGGGGPGLAQYLFTSGALIMILGLLLLGISAFMAKAACCPCSGPRGAYPAGRPPPQECFCIRWVRNGLNKRVLSTGWALDLGWQVHGAILSYRIGSFSLTEVVLVGLFGALGELLALLGSMVPKVQEVVGPLAM